MFRLYGRRLSHSTARCQFGQAHVRMWAVGMLLGSTIAVSTPKTLFPPQNRAPISQTDSVALQLPSSTYLLTAWLLFLMWFPIATCPTAGHNEASTSPALSYPSGSLRLLSPSHPYRSKLEAAFYKTTCSTSCRRRKFLIPSFLHGGAGQESRE